MKKHDIRLGFVPQKFKEGTHMCLIYKDDDERKQIISRYLESGIKHGEKVSYFAMKKSKEELLDDLKNTGVALDRERFEVLDALDTYCTGRVFIPDAMLDKLRAFYTTSKKEGHQCCRVSGEMHWALDPVPGAERIMEYEALVNKVVKTHPVTAICQYDARLFDGETIVDCLKVHPYMIVNGQVLENPYYMSPDEFLAQR
ncbi:MAG: MEDS domain-containing protein [Spirochaetales bacterium]|nr:MEDS domain-containing protein [Spirochaetales bacterium]